MNVKALAHVGFKVADMSASLRFYVDGLGFSKLYELTYGDLLKAIERDRATGALPAALDEGTIRFFEDHRGDPWSVYLLIAPGQFLELFHPRPGEPSRVADRSAREGGYHFCLQVEDIAGACAHLVALGIQPESAVILGPDHTKQCWLVDPDGHRLELQEYTGSSLQVHPGRYVPEAR